MKTFILSLIAATALCLPAQSQVRTVTELDSLGNTTRVIELLDTVRDGRAETDTLSITTYDSPQKVTVSLDNHDYQWDMDDLKRWAEGAVTLSAFVAIGLFLFFITPVVLIILIFYFRNKNRKQRFLLMQQALAAGQPLPKEVFKEVTLPDNRTKGIKNMALGLGLMLFLWMLTDEASIACIGLLIMCIGAGQLVIHYTTPNRKIYDGTTSAPHATQAQNAKPDATAADPTNEVSER